MSESDSPKNKKIDEPLTATQKLRNLINGLLSEEDCPAKDRMTTKQRATFEGVRKSLDESRIDEAQAAEFIERLKGMLAEPEPKRRMTKEEIQGYRARISKIVEDHKAREARLDWEAGAEPRWSEKTTKKKPPGPGYVM